MSNIEGFHEVRQDGKIIAEGMTVEQIAALGPIEKVVAVRWNNFGRSVSLTSPSGILARVVPGGNFVAAIQSVDATARELAVFNADGSRRLVIPNVQVINGKSARGSFGWFEISSATPKDAFSVIFRPDGPQRRLDINAVDGKTTGVHETR